MTDYSTSDGDRAIGTSAGSGDPTAEGWLLPPPVGWSDPLTGTDGPRYWDRVISSEEARLRRSKRTATIVVIEFAGFDELARRWGHDAAASTFVKLARTLANEIRSSDYVARVERTQFAILLTETNEIAAINFVERARSACETQLGMARDVVRVGIGWSSPSAAGRLAASFDVAAKRLASDLK